MKLVNSTKIDLLFAGLSLSTIQEIRQAKAPFVDDALKTWSIKYLNVESSLLFTPQSKFLTTGLPADRQCCQMVVT